MEDAGLLERVGLDGEAGPPVDLGGNQLRG